MKETSFYYETRDLTNILTELQLQNSPFDSNQYNRVQLSKIRIDKISQDSTSFEAAIMRQSWYPAVTEQWHSVCQEREDRGRPFLKTFALPKCCNITGVPCKAWHHRSVLPFLLCSSHRCVQGISSDVQAKWIGPLPLSLSDLSESFRSTVKKKPWTWSTWTERKHCQAFWLPRFWAAVCSSVDVPADDPLNNGTRQHDEAVRELQGESIGELVVEASLRSDLHEHSQALKTNK